MAPRGRGGSSGGSGYSSSFSDNPWFQRTRLFGAEFQNGYTLTALIFEGIFFVALAGIATWAAAVKRKHKACNAVNAVMVWSHWGVAVWFGMIYYIWVFIVAIIHENQTAVFNVYFIVGIILDSTIYVAEIFLLLTIYTLLHYCFTSIGQDPKRRVKTYLFLLHRLSCAVLGALYIVILALNIRGVVQTINSDGNTLSLQSFYRKRIPTQSKINVAYQALYFVASIEVLLASAWLLVTAMKHELPRKIGLTFIGSIGVPLFIRRIFFLSYGAAFGLSFSNKWTLSGALAKLIVTGFCNIFVYAGVVLALKQLAESSWKPWEAGQQAGHGPMIANGPSGATQQYPPQQYLPQQNPSQQNPSQQHPPYQEAYAPKGPGEPRSRTSELPVSPHY